MPAAQHRMSLFVPVLGLALSATGGRVALARQAPAEQEAKSAVIRAEFIFDEAGFASCHASTLAVTNDALVAAWFGGTGEGNKDVGIWFSRRQGAGWTEPVEVANGNQPDGSRYPCWNPVLFQPASGPLLLFYKVGPSPRAWWGMLVRSTDGGRNWGSAARLPAGILGPIKNKPVQLADGRLLCGSSTEDQGWRVHMESTPDLGTTWTHTSALNDGKSFGAIQPTILRHGEGRLQILCRSKGLGKIVESRSVTGGKTWSRLRPTTLPNPNSGIDAVTMRDGRHVLVYNHTARGRSPLNVAVSPDGTTWFAAAVLERERGEYSYPAVIQSADGHLHISYTWLRRKIKHVELDPEKFHLRPIQDGQWPN